MRKKIDRQYILNRETLEYEEVEQLSTTRRYIRTVVSYAVSSISVFVLSLYLITDVFHTRTPKGMIVYRDYSEWRSKLNLLERFLMTYAMPDTAVSTVMRTYGAGTIPAL